jgi:hypothetical protein
MKKDWVGFVGILAIVFGIITIISNNAEFSNSPFSLKIGSTLGLLVFVGGLAGVYYAFR